MKAKLNVISPKTEVGASAEIEAEVKEINEFLAKIIPDFVKEGGGILSDTVRYWRWKNKVGILKKAKKIIENLGLRTKKTPLKLIVPLLDFGSLEEDETIQQKWANLLANAMAGNIEVKVSYIKILNELSPIEASILDKIYEDGTTREKDYEKMKELQYDKDKICTIFSLLPSQFDLMIEKLFSLGVCQQPGSTGITFGTARVALRTTEVFELTSLGIEFIKACRSPEKKIKL